MGGVGGEGVHQPGEERQGRLCLGTVQAASLSCPPPDLKVECSEGADIAHALHVHSVLLHKAKDGGWGVGGWGGGGA